VEPEVRYLNLEDLEGPAKNSNRPALCFPLEGKVLCVVSDGLRIRIVKVRPYDYHVHARFVPFDGGNYPPGRFIDQLIEISRHRPSTRAARRLIAEYDCDKAALIQVESEDTSGEYHKGETVEMVCDQLGLEPRWARKMLRASGIRAPYEDEVVVLKILRAAIKSCGESGRPIRRAKKGSPPVDAGSGEE
jgi:hypothetical protein